MELCPTCNLRKEMKLESSEQYIMARAIGEEASNGLFRCLEESLPEKGQ
jgi:plasmid rolling circle replication initiator protein Rep